MLYGVSCYFEHQPMDRLADGVAMMAAAKINYARIGDSVWSLSGPGPGRRRPAPSVPWTARRR